jgi:hypothetical protein
MNKNTNFSQMGMAALLPGMQYLADQMQAVLDEFRAALAAAQAAPMNGIKRGRPPQADGPRPSIWSQMTAVQRSAEMKRRIAKRKNPAKARKWPQYSPAQLKKRIDAVAEGKRKAAAARANGAAA